jgi:hypothetical protein
VLDSDEESSSPPITHMFATKGNPAPSSSAASLDERDDGVLFDDAFDLNGSRYVSLAQEAGASSSFSSSSRSMHEGSVEGDSTQPSPIKSQPSHSSSSTVQRRKQALARNKQQQQQQQQSTESVRV